jgi:hypothetical protein
VAQGRWDQDAHDVGRHEAAPLQRGQRLVRRELLLMLAWGELTQELQAAYLFPQDRG